MVFVEIAEGRRTGCHREIVAQLFLAVRDFCKGKAQLDDMTTVVIKVDPAS